MNSPFYAVVLAAFLGGMSLSTAWAAPLAVSTQTATSVDSKTVSRREAVQAWAESRSALNAMSLVEALTDKDAMAREIAVGGLKDIGWTPASSQIGALLLKDPAFEVREAAAQTLRQFKDPSLVTTLVQGAADVHPAVRIACLNAAADFPSPPVIQALVKAAKDPFPEVRRTAVSLLGKNHDASAMPALLNALKDPDAAVRANAAQDIGAFAKMNTPSELKKLLKDPDESVNVSAARSLLKMGDISGLETCLRLAKSENNSVRLMAIDALGYTQDPAAKVLLGELVTNASDVYTQQAAKLSLQRTAQRTTP